jgi:hypothetical protein
MFSKPGQSIYLVHLIYTRISYSALILNDYTGSIEKKVDRPLIQGVYILEWLEGVGEHIQSTGVVVDVLPQE